MLNIMFQQSLCSEMWEEFRFAISCFGKSTKPVKRPSSKQNDLDAHEKDGPNGALTPLTASYHETNALNHRVTFPYSSSDALRDGNYT